MTLDRGTLLNNRYKIVDILGQGGMASIYRAVDENLNLDVAVKENLFTTEEYARQFRLEAVILAGLRHPNLPRVTDHFVILGQGQYLVMDYIEGEDLRQRMDRIGVLPEEEVIVMGVAITEALQYLHTRTPAIYHRDIKPGNVKVNPQGHVYLVDFGLAKVENEGQLTTTGARAMTPGYSPPEQYGTARTDQRTDIYSLGATLYSALTNCLPEDGLSRAMGQGDLTPIRYRNPSVSRRLGSVIEKALEVHPEDRYQDAEQFQQELLNCRSTSRRKAPLLLTLSPPPIEEESHSDTEENEDQEQEILPAAIPPTALLPLPVSAALMDPASKPRRRRKQRWRASCLTVILIGLLALVGGAAIFLIIPPLSEYLSPGATQATAISLTGVASQEVIQASPIGTDRSMMIATMEGEIQEESLTTDLPVLPQTQVFPTQTPMVTPMAGTETAQIAFASNRDGLPQIYLVNADGTGLKRITDMPDGACQPDFSPDGMQIVFISPCQKYQESYSLASMFIIDIEGGNLSPLPNVPGGDYDPAWSPDGKYIVFTSLRSNNKPKMYLLNLEDESVILLADEGTKNMQPAWSPDGKEIAFVTNRNGPQQIWFMNADGSDQRLFSRSMDLVNSNPSWSPDGKVILFTQYQSNNLPRLMASAIEEGEFIEFPVTQAQHPMRDARYSTNNAWLVLESWQWVQSGYHNIYIMSPSGVNSQQITNDAAFDFQPVWRPVSRSP
jgi:serine/threonine protein kinase/Tol biopolymer transport system component